MIAIQRYFLQVLVLIALALYDLLKIDAPILWVQSNRRDRRAVAVVNRDVSRSLRVRRAWFAPSKTTDLNSLFANIYEGSRYVMRENGLMPPLVTRLSNGSYAPRIFSRTTQTSASAVTEGSAISESTLAKTAIGTATPITVRHGFILTDQMQMTDPDGAGRRAAREAGLAVANKIDTDLTGLFDDLTAQRGTGGSALTLANVAAAMADLHQNSTAAGLVRGVVGVYQWYDLYTQLTSVTANPINVTPGDLANEAMRQYFVQNHAGAFWFQTPVIGTTGTAGTAYGALFKEDAFAYDERQALTMETARDEDRLGEKLYWSVMYAAAVQDSNYGVGLRSRNYPPA